MVTEYWISDWISPVHFSGFNERLSTRQKLKCKRFCVYTCLFVAVASLLPANEVTRVKLVSDGCFQMNDDKPAALVYRHAIKQMTLCDVPGPSYSARKVSVPRFISESVRQNGCLCHCCRHINFTESEQKFSLFRHLREGGSGRRCRRLLPRSQSFVGALSSLCK